MNTGTEPAQKLELADDGEAWASGLSSSARNLAAAVLGGLVTGMIIGGVGGRLAMFVLRLTSDPSVIGLKTDDDFTIGRFSGSTLFLLLFTAGAGILGGLLYFVVRSFLPPARRALLMGAFAGVVGGSLFVRPGGVDFSRLSPLPVAIALFVALPAAYGFALSVVVERWLSRESRFQRSWVGLLGLIPLLLLGLGGVAGLVAILLLPAAWLLLRAFPSLTGLVRSPPVTWSVRALLAALAGLALIDVVRDTVEIV